MKTYNSTFALWKWLSCSSLFSHHFHYNISHGTFLLQLNVLERNDLSFPYWNLQEEVEFIFKYFYNNNFKDKDRDNDELNSFLELPVAQSYMKTRIYLR